MFLYFLPDARALSAGQLAAAGLAHAFEASPRTVETTRGPGDRAGLLLGVEGVELRYRPDAQRWRAVPGAPAWVGLPLGAAVEPDQLLRREPLDGAAVELADGRPWLVPVARAWVEDDGEARWLARLPQALDLDDEGRWIASGVAARYARLWAVAERWQAARVGADIDESQSSARVEFADLVDGAVEALSANYRIGRVEAAMLGIFTTATAPKVLDALVDFGTLTEWLKKKVASARDGGDLSDGPEDSIEATGPR